MSLRPATLSWRSLRGLASRTLLFGESLITVPSPCSMFGSTCSKCSDTRALPYKAALAEPLEDRWDLKELKRAAGEKLATSCRSASVNCTGEGKGPMLCRSVNPGMMRELTRPGTLTPLAPPFVCPCLPASPRLVGCVALVCWVAGRRLGVPRCLALPSGRCLAGLQSGTLLNGHAQEFLL